MGLKVLVGDGQERAQAALPGHWGPEGRGRARHGRPASGGILPQGDVPKGTCARARLGRRGPCEEGCSHRPLCTGTGYATAGDRADRAHRTTPEPPSYTLTTHSAPADLTAALSPRRKFPGLSTPASYLQLLVYRQVWRQAHQHPTGPSAPVYTSMLLCRGNPSARS